MKQKIGITGGIGSGKSFIGNILLKMGYPLYDCDFRAKCMMREEGRLKNDIISVFGEKSYVDGDLNVAFLSELLFNDRRSLELMNSIVHPVVIDDFLLWCEMQIEDLIFCESALLFESKIVDVIDKIVFVDAPVATRCSRVMVRNGISEAAVRCRIDSQMKFEEFKEKFFFIIKNDDKHLLLPQLWTMLEQLNSD